MTDDRTITGDDALPTAAATKLAEFKDLACTAVGLWSNGDRKGAFDALGAAVPAAAAAAAVLNILLELDRAAEARERRGKDGIAAWWG
ncbi:hypothetical protein [Kitasatospora sp. NPDC051914]|uniref:hypothetical protein n=1 Tax=Kitasatospora sp. NPDC051914 TaxID=3154945 RepID=UPI003446BFEA